MRITPAPALLVLSAVLSGSALAQTYTQPETYGTGPNNSAADAAAGDFNNDGIEDLLTAHDGPAARLELRLGQGTGLLLPPSFAPPAVAMTPQFITIGDYNNDGNLDAVASGGYQICIFTGDGAGMLANTFSISHVAGPSGGVGAGDFDQNGNLDCAEIWIGPGTAIWTGFGNGTLAGVPVYASAVGVEKLRVADLDHDGELDLVCLAPLAVAVRKGGPAMTFSPEFIFILPFPAVDHFVADTTGDGAPEVLVCYGTASDQFGVIGNNGGGLLIAIHNVPTHVEPMRLSAADADGDGLADVFVSCHHASAMVTDATLDAYQNNGSGGFSMNEMHIGNQRPRAIALADWNGDQRTDAAVCGETPAIDGIINILFNQGLDPVVSDTIISAFLSPVAVATADIDEDGFPDFAVVNENSNNVMIRFGDGSGGFSAPLVPVVGNGPRALAIADVNGDRNLDIVTADFLGSTLTIIHGTGTQLTGGISTIPLIHQPNSIVISDIDMDGDPDLVFGYVDLGAGPIPTGSGYGIIMNNGGGSFALPVYNAYFNEVNAILLQDFNGDGLPDLAIAEEGILAGSSNMDILINVGAGVFSLASLNLSPGMKPVAIATGDANRDGVMDIVMAEYTTNDLALYIGAGGGGFGAPAIHPAGANPTGVILTDITGDGIGELINTSEGGSALIRRVLGAASATSVSTGLNPAGLACADFKLRGKVDFVTANPTNDNVTVIFDAGSQPFGMSHYGTGSGGASGRLAMGAPRSPRINDMTFNLTCTNAPASSLGLGYGGDVIDFAGSDAFGVGAMIHVDLAMSTTFVLFDIYSDAQGNAYAATPIPNDPGLVGMTFYIQSLWVERVADGRAITTATYDIVTSRGLKVDITN
ncbi:MAG: VCBS repeat-containing protein [Planctomycetes bacterium]|nr:VCBS repeat-containing protein [Planctomycetota bacterium]